MKISFADTLCLKREAKKLGHKFPEKSYSHLRSLAAQQLFGVRSVHEFNRLRKQTVEQHLVLSDGMATCAFCGLQFYPNVPEDSKTHQAKHDAFEEATTVLNYTPKFYAQREANKKHGYALLSDTDPETQVSGALEVLRSWFDRSLDAAIGESSYWKRHPKFEEYVGFMLGATPPFPAHVVASLEKQYGRIDGVIEKGHSYWYPPK
ncbi:hypothetical protein [Polaromonas naphthalenivorans]|nr:hypothetical protein [Polaromonas naphthalenivorans]